MRNKFKNKKKWLGIVLLLLMLVATGCGKPVDEHVNPQDQEVQDAEKIDTEVRPSDILALKQALGEDRVLFYIPNEEIEAGIMQNIASFRGNFLVYGNSTENLDVTSFGGTFYLQDDITANPVTLETEYISEDTTYIFHSNNTVTVNSNGPEEIKNVTWKNNLMCEIEGLGTYYLELNGLTIKKAS